MTPRGGGRLVVGWSATALAVVVLAGCADDDVVGPLATITPAAKEAPAATAPAPSPMGGPERSLVPAVDLANRMAEAITAKPGVQVEVSTSDQSFEANGAMSLSPEDPRFAVSIEADGQRMDMRMLSRTVYVSAAALVPDGRWLMVDPSAEGDVADAVEALTARFASWSDPTVAIEAYRDAPAFRAVGTETVDGVEVTCYRAEAVTPSAAVAGTTNTTDVLLGPDDLPVAVITTWTGAWGTVEVSVSYRGWGEEVVIEPPPESLVVRAGSSAP